VIHKTCTHYQGNGGCDGEGCDGCPDFEPVARIYQPTPEGPSVPTDFLSPRGLEIRIALVERMAEVLGMDRVMGWMKDGQVCGAINSVCEGLARERSNA
jgi:hypothetical protein